MKEDSFQQREVFFTHFVEHAVEELPDGTSRCNIGLVREIAQKYPKGAQLAMQDCWRSYIDDPHGQHAGGSRLFATWIGVGYVLAHGIQKEFFAFLDKPSCCPGLTNEIIKAIEGM